MLETSDRTVHRQIDATVQIMDESKQAAVYIRYVRHKENSKKKSQKVTSFPQHCLNVNVLLSIITSCDFFIVSDVLHRR